ncbi:hypothetical protein CIHG_07822 [Coccidioides immitis H538.4]|uniref:Uncharacterized protein n=1 Tax=Coccidioides immitis H538.4 TaxID=396776 RepID=A0A0J8S058_COCIT|nr:hypothetical protein CIHG_07822 [Coccidioides immitis H538.4]
MNDDGTGYETRSSNPLAYTNDECALILLMGGGEVLFFFNPALAIFRVFDR